MPKIIYKIEKDINNNLIKVPYCGECFNQLSILGLKDKETEKIQLLCTKCGKILLGDESEFCSM